MVLQVQNAFWTRQHAATEMGGEGMSGQIFIISKLPSGEMQSWYHLNF